MALSNPTKLNKASTRPSAGRFQSFHEDAIVLYRDESLCVRALDMTTMRMSETEIASIHNITRAEIFTSRQAIQMEMAVTNKARKHGRSPVAGGIAQQQISVMVEATDYAGSGSDIGEQQTPRRCRADRRRA